MFLKNKLRKKRKKGTPFLSKQPNKTKKKMISIIEVFYLALRTAMWVFCTCVPSKERLYKGKIWNLHFTFL